MREILFRGKREKDGEWVYGSLIRIDGGHSFILQNDQEKLHPFDRLFLDDDTGSIDGYVTKVVPESVGQFTGLVDKNGTKIFEGDIISEYICNIDTGRRYKAEFIPNRGGWYPFASGDGCGCCESETIAPDVDGVVVYVEVIGNIYDNPELLKGE